MTTSPGSLLHAAGLAIGIGMGGFVDGILFHQIFQFHNMLSARIPTDNLVGAKVNMVWDGLFHTLVWIATAIGIWLLWKALTRRDVIVSGKALVGSMLMGWGLFNVIEGVINHHLLNLHHVYELTGLSMWDYAFLIWGALMILGGMLLRPRNPR
jgi:uncharacterized membrane protein